ncbi:MAG: hypothetical protein AAF434_01315 [Pseudomonadota bacterium]
MGSHDEYGKELLRRAAGADYEVYGLPVEVDFGAGQPGRIDGSIAGRIAVEVESRVSKQIRGAVLDLVLHKHPKKLLIILPKHASNPTTAAEQCRNIMSNFLSPENFEVLLLQGHGDFPKYDVDVGLIQNALRKLGYRKT